MTRDDRVAYIYLNLIDKKNRNSIYRIIEDMGITSISTAQRTAAKIDKWGKSEKELFIATYTPAKNDREAVEAILDVKKEPVLKDGDIIEHNDKRYKFVYTGYTGLDECDNCCLNGGNEYCICENKIDLESVPGYFIEDTETIALDETGRDEKAEEIRLLNLELQEEKIYRKSFEDSHRNDIPVLSYYHNEGEIYEVAADFREIIEEMIQLYISKNKDYGNAFSQSYDEFGAVMAVIRINDKLNRFKTLIKQNSEVKTESIKDTLIDLANYAVMTIIEINRRG